VDGVQKGGEDLIASLCGLGIIMNNGMRNDHHDTNQYDPIAFFIKTKNAFDFCKCMGVEKFNDPVGKHNTLVTH